MAWTLKQIESRRISRGICINEGSQSVKAASLYDFNYVILGKRQNYGYNEKMSGCYELLGRDKWIPKLSDLGQWKYSKLYNTGKCTS